MIKHKAVENFKNGYSCSESIIQACIEEGLCPSDMLPCATTFSAGMSSGCVCGTVAAAQMISGFNNPVDARANAKFIVDEFKKRNKVTCCRILAKGLQGAERKQHCSKFVADVCEIMEELVKVKA